jgi:hypothetical protein
MPIGDSCWVKYAEKLRRKMCLDGVFELTVPISQVHIESGTDVSLRDLEKPGYWNPVREAKKDWDTLPRNGVLVDFEVDEDGTVRFVTFRLDEKRSDHLRRMIDRRTNAHD